MLDQLQPIAAACDLTIPAAHRRRIAVVGAGAIVDFAHLPAYATAGLEVTGVLDLDAERAADVAARHGLPRAYGSLDELLEDASVDVVDIGVNPPAQPDIACAALAAGKHVLCQKPLALEVEEGERIVAAAREHGRKLAVNQQLRFDEGIAAARAMVDAGWVGAPLAMSFSVDISTDWTVWPWLAATPRLEVMFHSIHFLDAIRSILGQPERVFCTGSRRPGQDPVGETRSMITLMYPGELRVLLHVTHENLTGERHATFRLDGTEGTLRGTLGLLYDYPHGRPDTLEVFSTALPTDGWLPYPVTGRWLPDAFAGPMKGLLAAIAEEGEAPTSGEDNLETLRLVHALYRSMDGGEVERLDAALRVPEATAA